MTQSQAVTPQPNPADAWWTPLEVAIRLKLHDRDGNPKVALVDSALYSDKTFPRPSKIRGKNRFRPAAIIAWEEAQGSTDGRVGSGAVKRDGTPAKKRGRKPAAVR